MRFSKNISTYVFYMGKLVELRPKGVPGLSQRIIFQSGCGLETCRQVTPFLQAKPVTA